MRDVREMRKGDFVKTGPGQFEEIASVSPGVDSGKPLPKDFYVVTADGKKIGMWKARAYFKKEDLDGKTTFGKSRL